VIMPESAGVWALQAVVGGPDRHRGGSRGSAAAVGAAKVKFGIWLREDHARSGTFSTRVTTTRLSRGAPGIRLRPGTGPGPGVWRRDW
jgi:hypothetical protein